MPGMADSPGGVAVPDVAELDAEALLLGKAGHHCVGKFELDLAIEGVQEIIFGLEVGE